MYKHVRTKENGDATANYDIIGEYPIKFIDFIHVISESDSNSFRIVFYDADNWTTNKCEIEKRNGEWYITLQSSNFIDKCKNKNVVKCRANGGYGQMSYFCTFEE